MNVAHTTPRRRLVGGLAVVTALGLGVVACGDDDDDPVASETTAGGGAPTTTEADAPSSTAGDTTETTTADAGPTTTAAAGTTTTEADAPTTTVADPDDPATLADRDAELRFAMNFAHNTFDPHTHPSRGDSIWMRPIYDQLLYIDIDDEGTAVIVEGLATAWEFTDGGLSFELELRDDVTFQDGNPFDAEAVKANLDRAKNDPASTEKAGLASVASVEVVDPTHVVIRLSAPDPALPWLFATEAVGMIASPAAFGPDLATKPVGSGPYKLVSEVKGADVVYERWDDHWNPDAALASKLTISTIVDGNARYNGIRTGEFDCGAVAAPLDVEAMKLAPDGFHVVQRVSWLSYGVFLNTTLAPMDDVRVRRAVSMALDREQISDTLLGGIFPPLNQFVPKGFLGYNADVDQDPYDPDAAAALVTEAGAEGATVVFGQPETLPTANVALVVQEALGRIGLNVELKPLAGGATIPDWLDGGEHGQVNVLITSPEPAQSIKSLFLGAYNHGEPPAELVALADEGLQAEFGSPERAEIYEEISAYMVENPIHVPIAQFATTVLCAPPVVGSDALFSDAIGRLNFRGVGVGAD